MHVFMCVIILSTLLHVQFTVQKDPNLVINSSVSESVFTKQKVKLLCVTLRQSEHHHP